MPHWSAELQGAATAPVATIISVGASVIQILASSVSRVSFTVDSPSALLFFGYGATAVASQSAPRLGVGAVMQERDWNGQVSVIAPAGTFNIFVLELGA